MQLIDRRAQLAQVQVMQWKSEADNGYGRHQRAYLIEEERERERAAMKSLRGN